nr:MAG TPA: hypothetical protein [Caudoviricetes sp.]
MIPIPILKLGMGVHHLILNLFVPLPGLKPYRGQIVYNSIDLNINSYLLPNESTLCI